MTRSLVLTLLGLLLHSMQAALAVALGVEGIPVAPAVVLVAYAALAEPPVEAAISAAFLGLVLDALTASPIGLNMLACLLALLAGRFAAPLVSAPMGLPAFMFGALLSAGYHLFLLTILKTFGAHREGLGLGGVFTTAVWDGAAALVLMPFTQWLMVALGLDHRQSPVRETLGRGAARAERRRARDGMRG